MTDPKFLDTDANGVLHVIGQPGFFRIEHEYDTTVILYIRTGMSKTGIITVKSSEIARYDSPAEAEAAYERASKCLTLHDAVLAFRQGINSSNGLSGAIKDRYDLSGRDWIRRIDPADREVLCREAFKASGYGVIGGIVRAATASRDEKGRFTSDQ